MGLPAARPARRAPTLAGAQARHLPAPLRARPAVSITPTATPHPTALVSRPPSPLAPRALTPARPSPSRHAHPHSGPFISRAASPRTPRHAPPLTLASRAPSLRALHLARRLPSHPASRASPRAASRAPSPPRAPPLASCARLLAPLTPREPCAPSSRVTPLTSRSAPLWPLPLPLLSRSVRRPSASPLRSRSRPAPSALVPGPCSPSITAVTDKYQKAFVIRPQ